MEPVVAIHLKVPVVFKFRFTLPAAAYRALQHRRACLWRGVLMPALDQPLGRHAL